MSALDSARLGALALILARKQREAADLRCAAGTLWAKAESMPPPRGFISALTGGTIIAEMKRRSPSGGALRGDLDPAAVALGYATAGAAALSVLTDGPDFGGSLDDMVAARDAVDIPVLRKDFTVDPVQIAEARVAGADAVLLIVAALDGDSLLDCLDAARRFGIDALVEVHDADETVRAVHAGATCIGVNNRDLRTLTTDLSTFARLRRLLPSGVVCIAESGVRNAGDVRRLVAEGADSVLVGEALMRSGDPEAACRELVGGGTAVIVKVCGVSTPQIAELAVETGADWIGMVFEPRSPRYVDEARAEAVMEAVGGRADLVGVVVDAGAELCNQLASRFRLNAMQVHGETVAPSLLVDADVPVIRGMNVATEREAYTFEWPPSGIVLLDAAPEIDSALPGGTGRRIPLEWAANVALHRRIVLAGGITPDNVADTIARVRPYGIDASSGLETAPGVKDPDLVRAYVRTARAAFDVVADAPERREARA